VKVARTLLAGIAWTAIAVLIALGGAGIVAAMNHVPGTAARAELTWDGDSQTGPALDAATEQLQQLSDEVDAFGSTARQALAAVTAGDATMVNDTIAAGTLRLAAVQQLAATLETTVGAVPGVGDDGALRLSPELQARNAELAKTNGLTDGLEADWRLFSGRALDATNLNALLARHDQETAAAAQQGALGKYRTALDLLDVSDATIAETRAVRDRLAPTTDVSTLTTWIDRNAAYDGALRELYTALEDSGGEPNKDVTDAFKIEQKARARLPVDLRPLAVIMADVAQGGLNQAVISIEETRGEIAGALDVQRSYQEDIALPE
jgi:hypothetical protein